MVVEVYSTREDQPLSNDRSPNDDVVRGTATAPDAADLRPALPVAAADVMIIIIT